MIKALYKFMHGPVLLARLFFVLLTTSMAAVIAFKTAQDPRIFSIVALLGSIVLVIIEFATDVIASRKFLLGVVGWFAGLILADLFSPTIPQRLVDAETSRFICNMMFSYFGIVLALKHSDWIRPGNLRFFLVNPEERPKILDSSVIIDGRINQLFELGLLRGPVLIPNFVLREIQGIADSSDPVRRSRGRRGLEVLDRLHQSCPALDIIDTDFPEEAEVDQKLIRLSQSLNGELVTNDFNLHKIAQIRRIHVVNLNQLADALRPGVYVGEAIDLIIVKAGKERGQGIGYLMDGTMVVVENGEEAIGQEREVLISNILQSPSGRLIFARLREDEQRKQLHA